MTDAPLQPDSPKHPPLRFATTRWSIVLAAGGTMSPAIDNPARQALSVLCRDYWYPLYAYVRRRGHQPDEAQDLTQSFFVHLLDHKALGTADPDRGRFRSFLLTALKHFLVNEWERASTRKRGGGRAMLPLAPDFDTAESRYGREPADTLSPERLYERRWAITLLDAVLADLEADYVTTERAKVFQHLKPYLTGDSHAPSHAQTAAQLDMTEGSVTAGVHRLRKKFRELLRARIEQTVESPEQVEDEIRDLFRAVRAS